MYLQTGESYNGMNGALLETKIGDWIRLYLWSGKTSKEVTQGVT